MRAFKISCCIDWNGFCRGIRHAPPRQSLMKLCSRRSVWPSKRLATAAGAKGSLRSMPRTASMLTRTAWFFNLATDARVIWSTS